MFHNCPIQFVRAFDDPEALGQWLLDFGHHRSLSFMGRSNVGKSTLINSLFRSKLARTSKTPGRTQKVNVFEFFLDEQKCFLYDVPGYGFAKVSKTMLGNWDELMSNFFINSTTNNLVINIQDARHPNQKADKDFYDYIQNYHFPLFVLFNKYDKLSTQKERAQLNKLKKQIFGDFRTAAQIHFVSAMSKMGLNELYAGLLGHLNTSRT